MLRLAILALILTGCGHHGGSHAKPKPPVEPPSTAFADIAGTYLATVTFATGAPYDGNVGKRYDLTIAADGTATALDHVTHALAATYHLNRLTDGTFTTDRRSLVGGLHEFGHGPADLSTFHFDSMRLWAGFYDQGTHTGSQDMSVVVVVPVGAG